MQSSKSFNNLVTYLHPANHTAQQGRDRHEVTKETRVNQLLKNIKSLISIKMIRLKLYSSFRFLLLQSMLTALNGVKRKLEQSN